MSLATLQLTQFNVQKLQCIGGEGRAAPYRITTYRGCELGAFGEVMEFTPESANDALINRFPARLLNRVMSRMRLATTQTRRS